MEHKHIIDFKTKPFLKKLIDQGDHIYGGDHELIGQPCFHHGLTYSNKFTLTIPYGAYIVDVPDHGYNDELLFVVAYVSEGKVEYCSAIRPDSLVPIMPNTIHARRLFHQIISGNYEEVRKENEVLKVQIKELESEIEKLKGD